MFAGGAGGGLFAGGVAPGAAASEGVVVCKLEGTATLITPTPAPLPPPAFACPVPLLDPAPAAGAAAGFCAAGLAAQGWVTNTVCVTVEGSKLIVWVGAAPWAKTVLVRNWKPGLRSKCQRTCFEAVDIFQPQGLTHSDQQQRGQPQRCQRYCSMLLLQLPGLLPP